MSGGCDRERSDEERALDRLRAEVRRLTDESVAWWALAKARLKIMEEQAATIERLKSDVALAAAPQVFRYATARASEAERINWLLHGLATKVTDAAADVDLPAPLREAIDALGKAERYERVPPAITRAIPTKDAEDVRRVGFELLTCALCWDPKTRLVGNLTAAQIADAAVGAMVAGGLSADEAHLSRIRVVETLLRDGDAALREASVYADEGEPIAERVRALAAERDAFRANASTWRTTADAHCNTIAERDKEIDRLRAENLSDRGMHEAQLASVAAERDHLKDRERSIIEACERVADGGQYRADIVSAIDRIRRERDAAKTEIARLTADLTKLGALKSAEIAPIIDRFTAAFGVDVPQAPMTAALPDWYIERTKDWPPDHPKPPPYDVAPWEHVSGTWYRTAFAPFEDYAAHVWILGDGRSGRVGVRVRNKDGREVKCEAARPDVGRAIADVLLRGFGWPV